jgi:UDP-3-O-[3-hydroxymyristoyl] glucosamine N-acyltransferase
MMSSFPKPLLAPVTAGDLAQDVGGAFSLLGEPQVVITAIAALKDAEPGSLTFCREVDAEKSGPLVLASRASVLVTSVALPSVQRRCLIVVDDPRGWFIRALEVLFPDSSEYVIDPTAQIAPDSDIARHVAVGVGTVIEQSCRIGAGTRIGNNVHIGSGTRIGKNVFIQHNAVIGSVGLGYHFEADGTRLFFPHLGAVIVGDNVVIGANTVIVRGMIEDTVVGDACRLGNLVNIGHNVKTGKRCAISSGACLVGGSRLGDDCNLGCNVTINANIKIGDGCQIGLGSSVTKSMPAGLSAFGIPAKPLRTMKRF